jgi:hypothetical protein
MVHNHAIIYAFDCLLSQQSEHEFYFFTCFGCVSHLQVSVNLLKVLSAVNSLTQKNLKMLTSNVNDKYLMHLIFSCYVAVCPRSAAVV